ncbi:DUF2809 domain-containing protein [Patiriisocius hiemis]|uniref:DUF2809 domain-containing protein n=1 Tax=Patiriisocius hiemis TaxID=3075604 RepID=A0ABU2YGC3_9FLAO|nr:DUF2809 domain-containing protein [Constantimarinum sp. W242]MDT0556739.1 DUF2809 domain-containing protein [Constantimarinum sp. W242]
MKKHLTIFTLLLVTEVVIALFHFNKFIRGFVGDVLVVPLAYFFLKIFSKAASFKLAVTTFVFAIIVEILQLFSITEKLNIDSKIIKIILGSTFDWWDILAYAIGFGLLLLSSKLWNT